MKTSTFWICLVFVIAGAFGLIWTLSHNTQSTDSPDVHKGLTLRLGGLGGKPGIINPIFTNETISQALSQMLFNGLVRLNKEMLPEPDLAESWDISPDGLTYTFHIRKGVKFHDGVELTAEDCKFTYEIASNPKIGCPWIDDFDAIKNYESPDKYTFKVTLKEPCAALTGRLVEYIVPKHLLEGKDIKTDSYNLHPIGTGPFRFVERTKDNKIILEANKDYYEGRPQIDRIIATGYDKESQCWSAFMHGEIDVIFFLSKENFEITRRDPDFKSYSFLAPYTYGLEYNPENPFFKDKKIRQAVSYAINTQELIHKVESGYGKPSTGPFLPSAWSSNPAIKPIEYNPKYALELLKEAGWSLNANNILEKDGKEFRITMLVNSNMRNGPMIARIIYQNLYSIGIRMDIKNFNYKNREEESYKKLAQEAEVYLTMLIIMTDPTETARDWHSKYKTRTNKLWKYQNPEVDKLLDKGQVTSDIKERQKIYHQIHQMLFDDQPVTFLYFCYHLGAVNARFNNTDSVFSPTMSFGTIKDWRAKE